MKRELRETRDGSQTLFSERWNQYYHSVHGAHSESMHVFIFAGFHYFDLPKLNILEVGLGTGLNALLTYRECLLVDKKVSYHALEAFPLNEAEWTSLDLARSEEERKFFQELHTSAFDEDVILSDHFELHKSKDLLEEWEPLEDRFDLIYFDAFAPSSQPELWTVEIFEKCKRALKVGGVLVTYCAKGDVKRNMRAAGLEVKALPGPLKKREMTRAINTK